jgi:hypothetical protein
MQGMPNCNAEQEKNGFYSDRTCRDRFRDIFKPPYDDKGLHSNGLWVEIVDETIQCEILARTSAVSATPVPPTCLNAAAARIVLHHSGHGSIYH